MRKLHQLFTNASLVSFPKTIQTKSQDFSHISYLYRMCVWYIGTCQSYIKLKILKSYFYICFKYTLYCILNLLNEGYVPQFQFEVMGLHPLLSQSMPQLTASLLLCKIYQSNHQIYWTNECKMDWWAFGIFKKRRE